ncbi:hypothetical protein ACSBLW_02460 [Thioclava sp. FR2]|uniref:hypothetical protein n=1 Tax=Thioclava sp. FR2 TaxID=3445780 RepID=UPI003EB9D1EA
MNGLLLAAGLGALALDVVHVIYGERMAHRPALASSWPAPAKALYSVLWHAATAFMALCGTSLIVAAFLPSHALALSALPVALFLATAGLFLYYGTTRLGSVRILPQWIAFSTISALALAGLAT